MAAKIVFVCLSIIALLIVLSTLTNRPQVALYLVLAATVLLTMTSLSINMNSKSIALINIASVMVLAAFVTYLVTRLAAIVA